MSSTYNYNYNYNNNNINAFIEMAKSSGSQLIKSLICKSASYPFYVLSVLQNINVINSKTPTTPTTTITTSNSALNLMNNIYKNNGLGGFYTGAIPSIIIISPIYYSTKLIIDKLLVNKVIVPTTTTNSNSNSSTYNDNDNDTKINLINFLTSLIYKYPKMIFNDLLIISPITIKHSFKIIKLLFLNIISIIPSSLSFPIYLIKKVLKFKSTVSNTLGSGSDNSGLLGGNNDDSSSLISTLFYSTLSILPILITRKLIIIGLNKFNNKLLSKNNNNKNSLIKSIYFNPITQCILITIISNPFEVVKLQYVNQFFSNFMKEASTTIDDDTIVPIIMNPISMAISIYNQNGLSRFFNGLISLSLFNLLNNYNNIRNNNSINSNINNWDIFE